MDTVRMIYKINPYHHSPAFFTPHPGSDLYNYCIENNLSLISSHDMYRRNPSEAKIKGIDYQFLNTALRLSTEPPFVRKLFIQLKNLFVKIIGKKGKMRIISVLRIICG
ncbi:hypothetical protein M1O19_03070, partial [Dehalococcoidia bacterium]|nr:hypothetical protein [Dehalococcoidia bacterium]